MQKTRIQIKATASAHAMREANGVRANTGVSYSGNQAALRRLSRITPRVQFQLQIGAGNDPLEAEADRVADEVMRMPEPEMASPGNSPVVRRKCAECEEEDARKLRTKSIGQARTEGDVPPIVHQVLNSPGQPLAPFARAFFEPRFGHDFSQVRVHTDDDAAESARAIGASAYTVRPRVVFGKGNYAPESGHGRLLLAHELTHVVQQENYVVARQPGPPKTDDTDATEEDTPKDTWKGTPVSEIVISLARGRVGFRIPSGMLLGTVSTDLLPGAYQLTAVVADQKWNISGPGVKGGLRFSVDLSESKADPWTLSYPATLPLTVSAGMAAEPKTYGDMVDPNSGALKDPLALYEGWGNTGHPQPVADADDYETISLDKPSVTPTADAPKPIAPVYRVKYRDGTEKTFVYAQLTDKMRAQLQPMFQKADEEFFMFTVQTFPMWWSVVSITPLAPMQGAGQRPYIPRRVPLAPPDAPPVNAAGGGAGEPPVAVAGVQGGNLDTAPDVTPPTETSAPAAAASNVFGGSGSTTETVELFHYGNLEGRSTFTSPTSYPRLTNCDIAITQADAAKYTGAPVSPNLRYKYQITIDKAFFTQNFKNTGSRGAYSEYGTSQPIPVKYFQKVGTLTGGSGGTPPPTTGAP